MSSGSYNGWKNYETWAVGMFLDGNYDGEGTYRAVLGLVESVVDDSEATDVWTLEEATRFNVADALKDMVDEMLFGDAPATLATDLLRAAYDEIDWEELADSKIAEVRGL